MGVGKVQGRRAARLGALLIVLATSGLLVPSGASSAGGTASISGHVENAAGEPVPCQAWALFENYQLAVATAIQPDGDYTISGLDAGTYLVEFVACDPYIDEHWDDKYNDFDPIALGDGERRAGVNATLTRGGSISGRVTDGNGNGLAGICVSARLPPPAGGGSTGTTDAQGNFTLSKLPTGDYVLSFNLCGRDPEGRGPNPNYAGEYYDGAQTYAGATPIHVIDGQELTGKNAVLVRAGSISGNVTDDQGAASLNVCVSAASSSGTYGSATTDANGDYRVAGLTPGSYALSFAPCDSKSQPYLIGESYSDQVPVAAGESVTGKDASLATGGALTGRITGRNGQALRACAFAITAGAGGGPGAMADANGYYTLTGLPVGDTSVQFVSCPGGGGVKVFDQSKSTQITRATTSTVDASLELPSSISGHVTSAGGGPIPGLCVEARPQQSSAQPSDFVFAFTNANGDYTFEKLHAGSYKVAFGDCTFNAPQSQYTAEYWHDKPTLASADLISLAEGQSLTAIDAELQPQGSVPPGGTFSSDPSGSGPTPANPVTVQITSPNGGAVSVSAQPAASSSPAAGYSFFGQQVDITAPAASVDAPLRLVFAIDASTIPRGTELGTVVPFRDGVPAGECTGSSSARPDPCVSDRRSDASGDFFLTVLTSHASRWNFGRAVCTVPKLKGAKLKTAKRKLTSANCRLGKVKRKRASHKLKGKVVSQSKKPKARIDPGTKVSVVVGK